MADYTRTISALPRGTAVSRFAQAIALAKGDGLLGAAKIAERRWRDQPQIATAIKAAISAATTGDASWAAPLASYGISQELVELLRGATVLGRLSGMRRVPFLTRIPRETTGASVSWVGQAAPIPAAAGAFDTVSIDETKIASIVVVTRDLLLLSSLSAEATIRNQLVAGVAAFLDRQFLDPAVTAVSGVNPAAITAGTGVTVITSTGSTAAQITTDLLAMAAALVTNGIPFKSPYWIMRPGTALSLIGKTNTAGASAFPGVTMAGGVLLGIPIIVTANAPAYIVLLDASDVLLADDGAVTLDASESASIQMLTDPISGAASQVSLWQSNLHGIRCVRYVNWARAHPGSVSVMAVAY